MLDPFAELTPAEEEEIDNIPISPELLERAHSDDVVWRNEKASLPRIQPPTPTGKPQ